MLSGLTAALSVSIIGTLSISQASPPVTLEANVSESTVMPATDEESQISSAAEDSGVRSQALKVGERQGRSGGSTSDDGIAKIYSHAISGRNAVTLYVHNIPVVTFLGVKPDTAEAEGVKVASVGESVPAATTAQDPMWRATTVAARINQLHRSGVEAKEIQVRWDSERRSYRIGADNLHLLEMSDGTISPQTTQDVAEDALQITNRLRRQLGNAEPLSDIQGRPQPPRPAQTVALGPVRLQVQGMASWYGPGFHGNRTANGERFNQYDMTAAHRNLPFGTRVRVTNLHNGRSVVVRINDRGPFTGGRVIDLSKGAAQTLGVVSSGVAPVRLDVLQ